MSDDCKHPDAYTRSKYVGDKFMGSVTYCRDCDWGYETKPKEETPPTNLTQVSSSSETPQVASTGVLGTGTIKSISTDYDEVTLEVDNARDWKEHYGTDVVIVAKDSSQTLPSDPFDEGEVNLSSTYVNAYKHAVNVRNLDQVNMYGEFSEAEIFAQGAEWATSTKADKLTVEGETQKPDNEELFTMSQYVSKEALHDAMRKRIEELEAENKAMFLDLQGRTEWLHKLTEENDRLKKGQA